MMVTLCRAMRMNKIIKDLEIAGDLEFQTNLMTFINSIVIAEDQLENRVATRHLLSDCGLPQVVDRLQANLDILSQVHECGSVCA